ncbi:MAG: DUF3108 domain-containing protein [Candidatus Aceula meridiana]|nr:DUF3108 domain-containing protein [Candidatus Aceula meridiana]
MKRIIIIFIFLFSVSTAAFAGEYDSYVGEKITYDIKSLSVNAGTAITEFKGLTKVDGKEVYLILFKATSLNFLDIELIYADPQTLYPIKVVRDLDIWGSKEKITESYDQDNFSVKITKIVNGKDKPEITTIKKDGIIDNLYCFIYRFRKNGRLENGNSLRMNLPTKDIDIRVAKKARMKAAGKVFDCYYLHTTPKEYAIWFSADKNRFALRIDKGGVVGGTSMRMVEYQQGK